MGNFSRGNGGNKIVGVIFWEKIRKKIIQAISQRENETKVHIIFGAIFLKNRKLFQKIGENGIDLRNSMQLFHFIQKYLSKN